MEAMTQAKPLSELSRQFVSHFGEMGSRWGINRTVGQIYALLFISPEPLNADQIADTLEFSRSNVSMGLKELQAWRLVQLRHQPGDRREYFQAPEDVWEIFKRLAEERRRREIEPTQSMLRAAMMEEASTDEERYAQQRMRDMHELIDKLMSWFDDVQRLSPETAMQLMGMGSEGQDYRTRQVRHGSLTPTTQVLALGTSLKPRSTLTSLTASPASNCSSMLAALLPTSSLGVWMVVRGGTI